MAFLRKRSCRWPRLGVLVGLSLLRSARRNRPWLTPLQISAGLGWSHPALWRAYWRITACKIARNPCRIPRKVRIFFFSLNISTNRMNPKVRPITDAFQNLVFRTNLSHDGHPKPKTGHDRQSQIRQDQVRQKIRFDPSKGCARTIERIEVDQESLRISRKSHQILNRQGAGRTRRSAPTLAASRFFVVALAPLF